MLEKSSPVAVAFAINDLYIKPLLVTLLSLFENAHTGTVYAVHILNYKLKETTRQKIMASVNKWHPQSTVIFLDLNDEQIESIPYVGIWGKEANYRLFLPALVPSFASVIYLDADILVQSDLSILSTLNLAGKAFAGVRDELWVQSGGIQQRLHCFSVLEQVKTTTYMERNAYCNSGVLVLNLAFFRQHNFTAKAIAMLNKYKDVPNMLPDQDVLNFLATCEGSENIYFLPAVFNWNPSTVTFTPPEEPYEKARWHVFLKRRNEWVTNQDLLAITKPQIIHFAGRDPWRFDRYASEATTLYEQCALRSGWKIEDSFVSFRYKSFLIWLKRLGNKEKGLAVFSFLAGLATAGLIAMIF